MLKNFILLLTLLLASACSANTLTRPDNVEIEDLAADLPCRRACPDMYELTCGFNGSHFQPFPNPCEMRMENCHLKKEQAAQNVFVRTDDDWCTTKKVDNLNDFMKARNIDLNKEECLQMCTLIYLPVCISNGEYRTMLANRCLLDSVNCALQDTEFASKPFRVLRENLCVESQGSH